ncbi:MAG: DUF5906 domain-containing protein [Gallionella sp.]|jgi:hypothetical protein
MLTTLPTALAAMGTYSQFVLYKLVPSKTKPGKMDKLPCDWRTGQLPPKGDGGSDIWTTFANVSAVAPLYGSNYGVGFSFAASDPFWFLDIDNCLVTYPEGDPTPPHWNPIAIELCAAFPGAAIEVSTSGRGLHLFGTGTVPEHGCTCKSLGLEFYHEGRFVALTGTNAVGNASTDCTTTLAVVVPQYFPPSQASSSDTPAEWTDGPCSDWRGPSDDDELIRRMLSASPSAASAFGGRATLADLWDANVTALTASYPDSGRDDGCPYSRNGADAALVSHLAWWTGRDCERMARLLRRSGLAREKHEREDYIQRTILNACAITTGAYRERQADVPGLPAPDSDDTPGPAAQPLTHVGRLTTGSVFASPEQQLDLWRGFTYVTDANIILTATGQQLGPDQFKNRYGGSVYVIDTANGKTTDNAWLAFTHSQATRMPKVDHSAFRPDLDPSAAWERDGASFVNSYRRLNVARAAGDVVPFLNHMEKVLPVKRDRDILLAYMAAIVQHQGVKFQWAPLIQGMQGNGKSLFSRCVEQAVGSRYTHMPRASELAEKFNDWLVGKIFIGVEDVWYPEGRVEIIETLKPMITNARQPIRAMRTSERTMDICANFIVNSNHKDAIRTTSGDRRWCVMFCAQQEIEDLARDGMAGDYFTRLYGWLNKGGYAAVTDFLHTYEIPAEFGLDCLLSRAPLTSSTEEAIAVGLGRVEQEVMEAIHAGEPGFSGGWVSSLALDALLKAQRMDAAMPRVKRRDMMKALGFEHHGAFRDGRCTAVLPGTTTRPILYIKKGHWAAGLKTGADVMKAYIAAQMPGAVEMGVVRVAEGMA